MPKKPVRIVVVGSANIDLITYTDRYPRPGETIMGDGFVLGFGGKGANQAAAAQFCGAKVDMVARVGDDLFGTAYIRNFKSLGVGTRHVKKVKRISSGAATILVDETGQNRIVVVKGANDKLTTRALTEASLTLRRADTIVVQFEIPMSSIYSTVRFAEKNGLRCILNPAPACPVDLKRLSSVDYFIPNESEAESITGMPVRNEKQAKACATYLLEQGLQRVIITLGDQGALLAGSGAMEMIPAFPVDPIDTTGAGDAFIGSFATFLAEGFPEREAVARANLYAALSTTRKGTQASFIKRPRFNKAWNQSLSVIGHQSSVISSI
jgi:ribokinase